MKLQEVKENSISVWMKTIAALLIVGLLGFVAYAMVANGGFWCSLGLYTSDDQKALGYYSKAIEWDRQNAKAYGWRGNQYLKLGRYEEALADFNEALRLEPDQLLSRMNRARTYQALYHYEEALAEFTALIERNPADKQLYLLRALCLISQGNYKQAVADCTTVINKDAGHVEALMTRAMAEGLLRKYDIALEDATKAVEITPKVIYPYLTRAYLSLQMGQVDNALADVKKVYELDVQPELYFQLTLIYLLKNDLPIAEECANKAIELGVSSAHSVKAGFYLVQKDPANALREAEQAIQSEKVLGRDFLLYSEVLAQLGQYEEALAACNQAELRGPQKPVVAWQKGRIYQKMGNSTAAQAAFAQASKSDPIFTGVELKLGETVSQLLLMW